MSTAANLNSADTAFEADGLPEPADGQTQGRPDQARPRRVAKTRVGVLVAYAVAVLVGVGLFTLGSPPAAVSSFAFEQRDAWISLPEFSVPSQLTAGGLTAVVFAMGVLTAVRRGHPPRWVNLTAGAAVVLAFLVWAAAGTGAVVPVVALLGGALALSVPLIFGAMSGILCERSGVINIAIEGQLLFGAFAAAVAASAAGAPWWGLLAAPIAGASVGALLVLFAVFYRVDQIIVGVVLNTLILGLTGFLFSSVLTENSEQWNQRQDLGEFAIPVLSRIPVIGPILFDQSVLVYLMYLLLILLNVALFRSRWGLRTRAVGEHPAAADTVGIHVMSTRVFNVLLGGAVAGLGGAFFTIGSGLAFGREMSAGNGFIALAAMILGRWSPKGALFAALLFGFSKNLGNVLGSIGSPMPTDLLLMLPYLVTIGAVAGLVGRVRPPGALGTAYLKDGS